MPPILRRVVHEIRNPRLPTLIGFALAVMIAAALLSAGRGKEEPAPTAEPAASEEPAATPSSP